MHSNDQNSKLFQKKDLWLVPLMTVLAWLLSLLAIYDISSLPLFSGGTVADVEISDLYNAVGNRRRISQKAAHTTVVSIDGCSRAQISEVLERIAYMEPSALGLDVFFIKEDADGAALEEALKGFDTVVLPVDLHHPDGVSFFQNRIPGAREGFVNLLSSNATGSVREFSCVREGISSFAYVLAGEPPLETVRSNLIRFDGTTIPVIPAQELSWSDEEDIRGRIVLMGAMEDPSDMHRTPLGFQTSGVLLHAVVTEMMASGKYLRRSAGWLETSVAFFFCALFLTLTLVVKRKWDDAGTLGMRAVQLLLIFGLFIIGCKLYISFGWYFNLALTITMLAFGALVFDIVAGLYALIPDKKI